MVIDFSHPVEPELCHCCKIHPLTFVAFTWKALHTLTWVDPILKNRKAEAYRENMYKRNRTLWPRWSVTQEGYRWVKSEFGSSVVDNLGGWALLGSFDCVNQVAGADAFCRSQTHNMYVWIPQRSSRECANIDQSLMLIWSDTWIRCWVGVCRKI